MKKILIFSVAYHPFVGGAEVAVKEITDRNSEYEFDMITLNLDGKQKQEEKIGNITVYRIGGQGRMHKLLFPYTAYRKASTLYGARHYDAIWSIMASFSGFAALFFKMTHQSVPFLLTLQEGDPIPDIKRQVRFVYPLFKKIFTSADRIQAISTYLANFARDMGASCPIDVIPNGVDLDLFTREFTEQELSETKQAIGKVPGDVLLVTTSRLVTKNGVGDIIASLRSLSPQVKLLIIGTGELEQELMAGVRRLGLEERVQFLGFVEYKDIPRYLAVSDIFVRPSLSEGMGNSFVEAMAAGLPIIGAAVGGIPDFLTDKETGLVCKVRDPESIAACVLELLQNINLRNAIIQKSKAIAIEKYGWNTIVGDMKRKVFDLLTI